MNTQSNINNIIITEYGLDSEKERLLIDITFPMSIMCGILNTGNINVLEISKIIIETMVLNSRYDESLEVESFIALLEYDLDLNNGYGQSSDIANVYALIRKYTMNFSLVYDFIYTHIMKFKKLADTAYVIHWVGNNYLNNMSLELVLTQKNIDLNKPGLIF